METHDIVTKVPANITANEPINGRQVVVERAEATIKHNYNKTVDREQAELALNRLSKKDIQTMKAFKNPPKGLDVLSYCLV